MIQIALISSLGWGCLNAWLAKRSGRNPYQWFLIGILLGAFGVGFLMLGKKKRKTAQSPPKEMLDIAFSSDVLWYYLKGKEKVGPMSSVAIEKAYLGEKIDANTFVWNEKMDDWKYLKDLTS